MGTVLSPMVEQPCCLAQTDYHGTAYTACELCLCLHARRAREPRRQLVAPEPEFRTIHCQWTPMQ